MSIRTSCHILQGRNRIMAGEGLDRAALGNNNNDNINSNKKIIDRARQIRVYRVAGFAKVRLSNGSCYSRYSQKICKMIL